MADWARLATHRCLADVSRGKKETGPVSCFTFPASRPSAAPNPLYYIHTHSL
jgi:hypothetical protein